MIRSDRAVRRELALARVQLQVALVEQREFAEAARPLWTAENWLARELGEMGGRAMLRADTLARQVGELELELAGMSGRGR